MRRPLLISFVLTITFGCSDKQPDDTTKSISADSVIPSVSNIPVDKVPSKDTVTTPSNFFWHIIHDFIIPDGFIADTNRIKKIPYYYSGVRGSSIFIAYEFPFYNIDTATNRVFDYMNYGSGNLHYADQDSIRKVGKLQKAFTKVNSITGFYFTDKEVKDMRTDAFIEEWKFSNDAEAQNAEKEMKRIYQFVYFNSFAYVFRRGNYLYTFYSRSTWAAKRLEKLYDGIINFD